MQLNRTVLEHDKNTISALRHDLDAAGYTVSALGALWGDAAESALHRSEPTPARRALATQPSSALVLLARLFILGDELSADETDRALPTLGPDGAYRAGLVERTSDGIRAVVDLRPYSFVDARGAGSWWIASDLTEMNRGDALPEDHVLGVGGASTTLSGLMLPSPVASVLDLGTGCGIQAMHAARHSTRVIATDISERALDYARFNTALNGIAGIEFRRGSLYEPVAGERFDHIVTNPPFVITPRDADVPSYEYRDGGDIGDGLLERVVRDAAAHLTPGGVLQLLGNWEYRPGHGSESVLEWVAAGETPLETWIIERELQDPVAYAETWIRDGGTRPGTAAFARLLEAWLDDFDDRGVRQIGFGYVLLRRPVDGVVRLQRSERVSTALGDARAGLGAHLAECLAAWDWRQSVGAGFAQARLRVAPDVTEERHFWPGQEDPTVMLLRQGAGFGRSRPIGTALAAAVGACDGELTVAQIVGALAEILSVEERALADELLPQLAELVDEAILRPVLADEAAEPESA